MALSPEQLAELQKQITDIQSQYQDPATGLYYSGSYQNVDQNGQTGMGGENNAGYGNALTGYMAANYQGGNGGAGWSPDARAQGLDLKGNATTDWFHAKDPNKMGMDEKLILGSILAMAGGAAYGAMGGAGAAGGTGGGGMTNGAFLGEGAWAPTAGGALDFGAAGGATGTMGSLPLAEMGPTGVEGLSTIDLAGGGSALSGVGSALGSVGKYGTLLGGLLGGALGSQKTETGTESTKKMDPRMDKLVYGDGGLLSNATNWYDANKSGMNDAMRGALQQNRSLLQDPATMQGFKDMASAGQGLLNRAPAGNPFTSGQMPQFGTNLMGQAFPAFRR